MTTISLCIPTYHRPVELRTLLLRISELVFPTADRPDVTVTIIDNSVDASAKHVVDSVSGEVGYRLSYRHEARPGISFARNVAIEASTAHEFLAFIDDDEIPDAYWLHELLATQRKYNADVVCGPVVSLLPASAPPWMAHAFPFRRTRHRTGTELSGVQARTGNALIRMQAVQKIGATFHPELAQSGGEDTHFFEMLVSNACRIIWADAAVVTEVVPESRATVRWLARRAFRLGNNEVIINGLLGVVPLSHLTNALRGISQLLKGLLRCMVCVTNPPAALNGFLLACKGAGLITGSLHLRFYEYSRNAKKHCV